MGMISNYPSLVPVMACRLFGAKPLSESVISHCQLDKYSNKFQLNLNQYMMIITEENKLDFVICKIVMILFWKHLLMHEVYASLTETRQTGSEDHTVYYKDMETPHTQHSSNSRAVSILSCHFTSVWIPIMKIRRSHDHLTFIMEIPIPGKTVFILKQDQILIHCHHNK